MSKTSWQMGEHSCELRCGEPFEGLEIPFGAMVEYHPISAKDQSRLHQSGKKVLPGIFLGCALFVGEFGREMCWLQTWRSWKCWTRQKSMLEDSNAKETITPKRVNNLIFSIADAQVSGRDHGVRKSTHTRDQLVRSETVRGDLQAHSEKSQPTDETRR